jgi:glycosyltransferase involved in cell wall biosynthesis
MTAAPRLTIGLPVYNGERYLAESLEALLGQSYPDFELIISDNASTDRTEEICRRYQEADPRVRYLRQPRNIGGGANHMMVFWHARGELFKWASHDDLYARDLLRQCVDALDAHPEAVLAHAATGIVDDSGALTKTVGYRLRTDAVSPAERFASLLFGVGGDDIYGVIRSAVLRRVTPHDSYHHADRTLVAEIALHGPFHQVPELLYFRRDHPARAERANPTVRARCTNMDPRRANRLRHPVARLYLEYVAGYLRLIARAPLSGAQRAACYRELARWTASRVWSRSSSRIEDEPGLPVASSAPRVDAVVAGRAGGTR